MITKVMLELKKRGHDVDTSVYTVAQAMDALRACKRKGALTMLKDITIGQFFPGNSAVHRLDPRVKIVLTVALHCAAVSCAGTGLLRPYHPVSRPRYRNFAYFTQNGLRGLKPILLIVMFTAVLNLFYTPGDYVWQWKFLHISIEGIRMAIFMVLRLMLLIIATSMLTYTTSPIQLTDGLERLLAPLKKLHVPVHELSMMMSIALRFIPTFD